MSTREDREIDAREDAGWDELDERNEELTCQSCDGDGYIEDHPCEYVTCLECDGTGRIDPDAFDDPYWEPLC